MPVSSKRRTPEANWEFYESVVTDLLQHYAIIIENRSTILKMVDQYAEDYRTSFPRYVQMHKQISLSTLSAGLRDVVASYEIVRSVRAEFACSTARKR
jgi:predicted nucleic-acid-binding protein